LDVDAFTLAFRGTNDHDWHGVSWMRHRSLNDTTFLDLCWQVFFGYCQQGGWAVV